MQQYILSKDNARPQCDDKDNVLATLRSLSQSTELIHLNIPFTLDNLHVHNNIKDLYEYCFERGYILNRVHTI